jgi:hypothetical protein
VESEDPLEFRGEKVTTFLRSLGIAECFQSDGDQVLKLGVDDTVMCEFTHNITDAYASTVTQTDHS